MKETQAFIRKLKAEKRLSSFEVTKSIINAMKPSELRYAKQYLAMLYKTEFDPISIKLMRYLQDNSTITEIEARKDFSNAHPNFNFINAYTTLTKRLGWAIVSEYATQNEDGYSYQWRTKFEIQHNISLYFVMTARQVTGYCFDLLSETIEKAKEVEAYGELVTCLELKIRNVKARSEYRQITKLEEQRTHYQKCELLLHQANRIYFDLGTLQRSQGIPEHDLLTRYNDGLIKLHSLYKQTQSENILFFSLLIEAFIFHTSKDYLEAGKTFLRVYDMAVSSRPINSKVQVGGAASFLADNHIRQGNFDLAITFCKKAKASFEKNSTNYFQAEFLEFYALFYTNQFFKAEKKLQGILSHPEYRESEFLINTKKYLVACALFAQAKYQETLDKLLSLEKVWSDTTGWNVGIRMLIMLCYKMLGNYELMALERDRFRTLFDKYRHRKTISERDRIILKIINELLKSNNDFNSVFLRKPDLFNLLSSPGYEWKILSHEMIVFDKWFQSVRNKKSYRLDM